MYIFSFDFRVKYDKPDIPLWLVRFSFIVCYSSSHYLVTRIPLVPIDHRLNTGQAYLLFRNNLLHIFSHFQVKVWECHSSHDQGTLWLKIGSYYVFIKNICRSFFTYKSIHLQSISVSPDLMECILSWCSEH